MTDVELGGEMHMIEPKGDWGYGIRRGTSVFHVLRFANNAREAQEIELSFPVGDVGQVMGSAGVKVECDGSSFCSSKGSA